MTATSEVVKSFLLRSLTLFNECLSVFYQKKPNRRERKGKVLDDGAVA